MKTLLALLLLATPASAKVWADRCGIYVLTSHPGGVFVYEDRVTGSKVTCRLVQAPNTLLSPKLATDPAAYLSCDNGKVVAALFDGTSIEFDGKYLYGYTPPPCD